MNTKNETHNEGVLDNLAKQVAKGSFSRRNFLTRATQMGVALPFAHSILSQNLTAATPIKGGFLKAASLGGNSTDSLDPARFEVQTMGLFSRCWGELMLEIGMDGNIKKRLVEEYGSSKDAKVWTFKVRKGITFHNGKTMDASDIVKTIERHSGEKTKSGALGVMRDIESAKTTGKNEFKVVLKGPNADLPYFLTDWHLIVQPNGGFDKPDAGIGTGPYKVTVNEPGIRHGAEKYDGFWDNSRGFADQVEITVINDTTARVSALQSKKVHMINRVEPKLVSLVKRIPGVAVKTVSGRAHYVFVMHCNTPPFDNNDLREALKYAVDRKEMLDKILRGYGTIGNDFPINIAYPFFSDDIEQRPFDPDKAKFHYKKSKHSGPILLRTSEVAFPGAVDASQLFQASAAKAGIKMEIKREPGDGYWDEVWNQKPFCASYWSGRPTQDQLYSTAYLSTAEWNDTRFFNKKFDKLLFQAKAELNAAKRKQLYRDMALLVRNEGGVIVPFFNDFIDATRSDVGGFVPHPNLDMMDNLALVKTWLKKS